MVELKEGASGRDNDAETGPGCLQGESRALG